MFLNLFHKLLRLFWEPISKKESHWWNWIKYEGQIDPSLCLTIEGDKNSKPRVNFITNLIRTNFTWNKTVVLEVQSDFDKKINIGLISKEENKIQLCNIPLDTNKQYAFLLGFYPFTYFAIDEVGEQIKISFKKISNKKECSKEGVKIL